ncbi:hypothetical protein D3C81_1420960 [compost metagenome]|jgi:hypothetical protein
MSPAIRTELDGCAIEVMVDAPPVPSGASDKAGTTSDFLDSASQKIRVSLGESVGVLGQIASAFSASLANSDPKPSSVEINFGLVASGEAGNFIISKVAGSANFSVKMSWTFDAE